MSITVRISRSANQPPTPATGLVGAFGGTTPGAYNSDDVEIVATNKHNLKEVAEAAALAFSVTHGSTTQNQEI